MKMDNKKILVTRPNHDLTTSYLFYWSNPVLDIAKSRSYSVLDLQGRKATQEYLVSYIKKNNPALIFFNRHGSQNTITGHENEVLVESGKNENLLSSKIIYARSCESAKILGKKSVEKGAVTFIGYINKYVFLYMTEKITKPLQDTIAKLFLEPSNLVPISLLKGSTTADAYEKSQRGMRRNLSFVLSTEASSFEKNTAPYLWSNIKSQVVVGDSTAVL